MELEGKGSEVIGDIHSQYHLQGPTTQALVL